MKELFLRYGLTALALFVITVLMFQNVFTAKTAANDVMAQSILRKISDALENSKSQQGVYPASLEGIIISEKPFFLKAYFEGVYHGFTFHYEISSDAYTITAAPVSPSTGSRSYTITTGGQFR